MLQITARALTLIATIALAARAAGVHGVPGSWSKAEVQASIVAAVAYIDNRQNANGSYGTTFPIEETGMALVAYGVLGDGDFNNLPSTYQAHVKAAITWLLLPTQNNGEGSWDSALKTYGTGIVLAGLAAFPTVNDTSLDAAIQPAIAGGRNFLIKEFQGPAFTGCSSNDKSPTAGYCGGWNYEPAPGRSDESNTGFAMFGLHLTGGVPAAIQSVNIDWQHHIQQISTNPFAGRNDGGGSYQPGVNTGNFSSNANDSGTMLFGYAYDGVPGSDPHVVAGVAFAKNILSVYELDAPNFHTMVYHGGNGPGSAACAIGPASCAWQRASGEGGYHYSLFSITKGLGEYITANLTDPNNWYAKVVDLLLSQQDVNGSWPADLRDDASILFATELSVGSLGLVGVEDGFIEICKSSSITNPVTGSFTFTSAAFTNGPIVVPVGACSGLIAVRHGTVTITETPTTGAGVSAINAFGYSPVSIEENRLVKSDLPKGTAMVTIVAGDPSTETVVEFTNYKIPTGRLRICKSVLPANASDAGRFSFNVSGAPNNPYVVPAGACSEPIFAPAGSVTITETPRAGFQLADVDTIPVDRLVSTNIPGGSAVVTVAAGDIETEMVVWFINIAVSPPTGQLKICKVAGAGIVLNQNFTISANDVKYTVPAGAASQGGGCVLGTFPVGAVINLQEQISLTNPPAYQVLNIAVNPPDRINGTPDLANGKVGVTIGAGFTEVTFTNIGSTPTGRLKVCKIAGQDIAPGTNFTFTAQGPENTQTLTVPAGPAAEGGFCVVDGTFPLKTQVTVTEVVPAGTTLTGVAVNGTPIARSNRPVPVTIGPGFTELVFTNSSTTSVVSQACSSQSLTTIDPVHNTGYVPIFALDRGNAQLAVVDLTSNAVLGKITLPGANQPLSTAYNPNNQTMLAEAANTMTHAITIFEIDTTTMSLKSMVPAPGITLESAWGGILMDFLNYRAFVAGSYGLGILDTSTSPPTWNANSVVAIPDGTDSLSLNVATGIIFISGDGNNQIINTTTTPLVPMRFNSTFGITDGNAFDPSTNILLLSQEVGADQSVAFDFATLNTTSPPATARNITVPGLGEAEPIGEGPGGQAAINCRTHQAVVADEFGQNLKLIQLPVPPVDNNTIVSGPPVDLASVYTIAATVIPKGIVAGVPTQLTILGDPNSLTIDAAHNVAYMLADTIAGFHTWTPGSSLPLFLVKVDLSNPVPGACPIPVCPKWFPVSVAIPMPMPVPFPASSFSRTIGARMEMRENR